MTISSTLYPCLKFTNQFGTETRWVKKDETSQETDLRCPSCIKNNTPHDGTITQYPHGLFETDQQPDGKAICAGCDQIIEITHIFKLTISIRK